MTGGRDFEGMRSAVEKFLLARVPSDIDISRAKKLFREFLIGEWPELASSATIGDVISMMVEDSRLFANETACLIRYLSVPEFLPENNSTNNLYRNLVQLTERNLPSIWNFFKIGEKKQTYERLELLSDVHSRIGAICAPMREIPAEIAGIINSKQTLLGILNHSAVRAYCSPFGLAGARAHIENLLTHFARISMESDTLSLDVREAEAIIANGIVFCELDVSFFTAEYVLPLLQNSAKALEQFVSAARARLSSEIVSRLDTADTLRKRYPLQSEGRDFFIAIPLRNVGPSRAMSVVAQVESDSEAIAVNSENVILGNISPGDFSLIIRAMVVQPASELTLMVSVNWHDAGSTEVKQHIFTCRVLSQAGTVAWKDLEHVRPYTVEVAKGNEFVGRQDLVRRLAAKVLQTPMEPFFVTGQKRVGKTSLVLAAADFAKKHEKGSSIYVSYSLWGDFAYPQPIDAIKALGDTIAGVILKSLPIGTEHANKLEFDGSLAPLISLAKHAGQTCPENKYVVIIDEFDEIHQELYLQGNLAETFFANLRAFSTLRNICLILIGGENMPFVMDRQGQKLNRFLKVGLDYFSRDTEWPDFTELVRKPTHGIINWQDDAIAEIFNLTNGNPYFAKLLCAEIFSAAVEERDADLTSEEVIRAVYRQITRFDTNSFAHLWQDGVHKPIAEREPDIQRRKRFLVASARVLRERNPLTLENIVTSNRRSFLHSPEVGPVLNEFHRRGILAERRGAYEFALPVFQLWLQEKGIAQLEVDAIGEELARNIQAIEESNYITSTEREELVRPWPPYQGKYITSDMVLSWLDQVDSNRHKRLLFRLLQRLHFFDEQKVRTSLRTAHGMLLPNLPTFIQRRRSERRTDLAVTYFDGEGKSGQYYASKYAEENRIGTQSILSPFSFSTRVREYEEKYEKIAAIVVVDDIVATGRSWAKKIIEFAELNQKILTECNVPVTAIALAATSAGEQYVRKSLEKIAWLDIDLRVCELLDSDSFAFEKENKIWESADELEEAKALCHDLGSRIYPNNPLGFGNQGLLVVFPDTCPNNSLPILHSVATAASKSKWMPIFPRLTN